MCGEVCVPLTLHHTHSAGYVPMEGTFFDAREVRPFCISFMRTSPIHHHVISTFLCVPSL